MAINVRFALAVFSGLVSFTSLADQLAAPAPMLAPPQPVLTSEAWNEEQRTKNVKPLSARGDILSQFRSAYDNSGNPGIAIFWNRKFSDRLSQWEALARRSVTGEASTNAADIFKKQGDIKKEDVLGSAIGSLNNSKPSGEVLGSYERNVQGGSRILAAEYIERKLDKEQRLGMGESRDFEFNAGFMQPFLSSSAKIIDRQAIMRLVERDNARDAGSEMIADYQKVETDALIGYADYLAEIVFTPNSSADLGMSFMVSVKEVATGRVVAMFKSDGTPPKKPVQPDQYIATASGYQKAVPEDKVGTPQEVGEQLAYETMEALTRIWKAQ